MAALCSSTTHAAMTGNSSPVHGAPIPRSNRTPVHVPLWPHGTNKNVLTPVFRFSKTNLYSTLPDNTLQFRRANSELEPLTKMDPKEVSSMITFRDASNISAKQSVDSLPFRPAMTRSKQIPGRYFPKPVLSEDHKAVLDVASPKRMLFPSKINPLPQLPSGLDIQSSSLGFSSKESPYKLKKIISSFCNPKIAKTRRSLRAFPEIQTEVFSICFQKYESSDYDPNSELHSDYYSIRRVNLPNTPKHRLGQPGHHSKGLLPATCAEFAVVLRGHRKRLHARMFVPSEGAVTPAEGTKHVSEGK